MRSLVREVMLPAVASVAFLFAMAMPPAEAQELAATTEPVAALASASSAASLRADESGSDARVATEGTKTSAAARSARRCERVERIGKFVIRRCE